MQPTFIICSLFYLYYLSVICGRKKWDRNLKGKQFELFHILSVETKIQKENSHKLKQWNEWGFLLYLKKKNTKWIWQETNYIIISHSTNKIFLKNLSCSEEILESSGLFSKPLISILDCRQPTELIQDNECLIAKLSW